MQYQRGFRRDQYAFKRHDSYETVKTYQHPDFFTSQNLRYLSFEINRRLYGVKGPNIRTNVAIHLIQSIMDSVYEHYPDTTARMNDRVITTIVNSLKQEVEMERVNNQLDPWIQLMDGSKGIVSHPKPKINNRYKRVTTSMIY